MILLDQTQRNIISEVITMSNIKDSFKFNLAVFIMIY